MAGALLVALAAAPVAAPAAEQRLAVLVGARTCPDQKLATQVAAGLRGEAARLLGAQETSAAVARQRATEALRQARKLFTNTGFAGCVSLLSITEQELGRNLSSTDPGAMQRAHRLLAQVNLWLGICQWAAGDPQTAAASFVRSAQLPSSPVPDPSLLPPEVIEAYRRAVEEPRQEVSCELEAPLTPESLQVDGRGPTLAGGTLRVPAGTHYVVLKEPCGPAVASGGARPSPCNGGSTAGRSLRLEAAPLRCRVQLPVVAPPSSIPCISIAEAEDESFIAGVTRESPVGGTLVVSEAGGRLALRLNRSGSRSFSREVMAHLDGQATVSSVIARSIGLLLSTDKPQPQPTAPGGAPWYTRWWVWTLVGAAVAITATTAAVATRESRVNVAFGP